MTILYSQHVIVFVTYKGNQHDNVAFTTLHCLCKLQMGPIILSITLHLDGKVLQGTNTLAYFRRKLSVASTVPVLFVFSCHFHPIVLFRGKSRVPHSKGRLQALYITLGCVAWVCTVYLVIIS
jgi:hypothetical protein